MSDMERDKRTSIYFDRDKLCFVGLEAEHLKQIKSAYEQIDVDSELKKMGLWLISSKGKNRKGNIGFIINWLNNSSEHSAIAKTKEQQDFIEYNSPLRPLLLDYLQDLWKGKEHILEFNKIKKSN